MPMGWMEFLLAIATLVLGTGWLFTYRSYRREKAGEATQAEAEGWKAMQDLYQQTIADFKAYSEDMRTERGVLKKENEELAIKYKTMSEDILVMKKDLARQGRKIEAMSPFLCSVVDCMNRKRVNISMIARENEEDN